MVSLGKYKMDKMYYRQWVCLLSDRYRNRQFVTIKLYSRAFPIDPVPQNVPCRIAA